MMTHHINRAIRQEWGCLKFTIYRVLFHESLRTQLFFISNVLDIKQNRQYALSTQKAQPVGN